MHPTEEEKKEDTTAKYDPISGLEDLASQHAYQIGQLQGRFARLDKALEKLQYVLYGIALGLIIAEIARL